MIKNIIFDFDGVLVDSEILAAKAFSQYLSSNGFEFSEIEFENFAGKKTIEVIDILSNRFNFQDITLISYNNNYILLYLRQL